MVETNKNMMTTMRKFGKIANGGHSLWRMNVKMKREKERNSNEVFKMVQGVIHVPGNHNDLLLVAVR